MNKETRFRVIAGATLLALLLGSLLPIVALAQDETPTPTLEPSATSTLGAATATAEVAASETPAVASETPTSGLPTETATETPSETPIVDLSATATATLSTPSETPTISETPTVTPTHGMPLQSSDFPSDFIVWCPASVAVPVDGGMGCTTGVNQFVDLLPLMNALPGKDGTIWVGVAYNDGSNTDVVFDSSTVPQFVNFKLTIKGGWTGIGGTIGSTPSVVNHRLGFSNWTKDITLSNFTVDGHTNAGTGLSVLTTANLITSNVSSNTATGASGADFGSSSDPIGNVTITGGDFNNNDSYGLRVTSNGNVSLSGVDAQSNTTHGVWIDGTGAPASKTITVSGGALIANPSNGLLVNSKGKVTLTGVNASTNGDIGALINNYQAGAGVGDVAIIGGIFSNNAGIWGLSVVSNGNITASAFTADSNTGTEGAVLLDNSSATAAKTITVTGNNTSEINFNDGDGLVLNSDGLITVKDITANYNGINDSDGSGLEINNLGGTAGVTLTGSNILSGNYNSGLSLNSKGPVSASNITAIGQVVGYGAFIVNSTAATAQPITLSGTNLFNYNGAGVSFDSNGAITANNVSAIGNAGSGVQVNNDYGTFVSAVKFTGTNTIIENDTNGLYIESFGAVSLNNITADDNSQGGVTGVGVSIANQGLISAPAQNVTLTGVNPMSNNRQGNLIINSRGTVSVSSVTANGSTQGYGISIDNDHGVQADKKGVTLLGTNTANSNYLIGIRVDSYGAITLNNMTANSNGVSMLASLGKGANLNNESPALGTTQPIKLTGTNSFSSNYSDGLVLNSDGLFSANNLTANSNGIGAGSGNGVSITMLSVGSTGGVTFTGSSSMNGNYAEGMSLQTGGPVTLSNITANASVTGTGLLVQNVNLGNTMPMNVTLTGVNTFNSNFVDGLNVFTYGDIAISNLNASGNGDTGVGDGASLTNGSGNAAFKKVTLTGISVLSNNEGRGLEVVTDGTIAVNSVTASGNGAVGGVLLDNDDEITATAGVTITGTNNFHANDWTGLRVTTRGPITASNLNASGNLTADADGVVLDNDQAATDQKVTLTGLNVMSDNVRYGLNVTTKGAISLTGLTANGNDLNGVNAVNSTAAAAQAFTLLGTNVIKDNSGHGLSVSSKGAVTINNLTANGNGLSGVGSGASIFNDVGGSVQKVALTGINTFNDNDDYGLIVQSNGTISSTTKLTGSDNGSHGIMLSNNLADGMPASAITLGGTNTASLNGDHGFYLNSFGTVTVNNLTASGNGTSMTIFGIGLSIANNWDSTDPVLSDVKLTGSVTLLGNRQEGVVVDTYGNISTNNVNASDGPLANGADLQTMTEGKTITMTGNNYFNSNMGYGLKLTALGNITVNNLNANYNGNAGVEKGAEITNGSALNPRTVKLTGTNVFIGNYFHGLEISSKGAITVNNLRAHFNGDLANGDGARLINASGTANVTLTGVNSFRNNDDNGLRIDSNGAVVINKITAENNDDFDGLIVEPTASAITLMCGTFTNNGENGIDVTYSGVLRLVGVLSIGNGTVAADNLKTNGGSTPVVVRNCP